MAVQAFTVGIVVGAAGTAIGADAGAFSLRVSHVTKVGGSANEAVNGFPVYPGEPPITVTMEAGESIWAFAPVSPSQPEGTAASVFVLKND